MDFKEYRERLQAAKEEIEATRDDESLLMVQDTVALVKSRVINTGKDEEGQKFGDYSTNPLPTFFFYSSRTTRNIDNAIEDLKKKYGNNASYRDWRDINNLETDFINFSFSNQMWHSVEPVRIDSDEHTTTYEVGATGSKNIEIKGYHDRRFDGIALLSDEEKKLLRSLHEQRIERIMNKHLS